MNGKLKKWIFDTNNEIFRSGKKAVTFEQYEQYRGKYNHPFDILLESLSQLSVLRRGATTRG